MENEILKAIKERRSIIRFKPEPVAEEKIQAILEAGRWAPSFANTQPWEFIVVKDSTVKQKLSDIAKNVTISNAFNVQTCTRVNVHTIRIQLWSVQPFVVSFQSKM